MAQSGWRTAWSRTNTVVIASHMCETFDTFEHQEWYLLLECLVWLLDLASQQEGVQRSVMNFQHEQTISQPVCKTPTWGKVWVSSPNTGLGLRWHANLACLSQCQRLRNWDTQPYMIFEYMIRCECCETCRRRLERGRKCMRFISGISPCVLPCAQSTRRHGYDLGAFLQGIR